MRQESFERARSERWRRFEAMLADLEARRGGAPDFPEAYRRICQDLALALDRRLGAGLVDRLNDLALRGHQFLYGARPRTRRRGAAAFLVHDFPRAVRRDAGLFGVVSLLFYGSALLLFALDLWNPELVYHLLSGDQVAEFEAMYDPQAEHYGTPRGTVDDVGAFSFYVANNIGIAFRTFASGILVGLGSLFFLLFNGIYLGLVAAHITQVGYASTFFPFVIGHGSFELTAIVLAGLAGAKLGLSLLSPGPRTRLHALRTSAREAVPVLYGMTVMLGIAAVIEAFWSSSQLVSPAIKLAAGAGLWVLVGCWLVLGGRGDGD